MASSIDITKPEAGAATTQSVRDNFSAAKTEIEALQGTDHAAVTVTGQDYLTLSAQQITANAIDLDNLSASGTPSASTYLRGDNTWSSIAGGGDVSKVGTPVNNELAVWTGDGTIEGEANLTYDGTSLVMDSLTPRYDASADAGQSANLRLAGNNNSLGIGSFDILQNASNVAYVWQRASANLILRNGAIDALIVDTSGNVSIEGNLDLGATGNSAKIVHRTNGEAVEIAGGAATTTGGGGYFYASDNSLFPGDVQLVSDAQPFLNWDESAGSLTLSTGTGAKTTAATLDSSQNVTLAGNLTVTGIINGGTVHHTGATVIDPANGDSLTFMVPSKAITITGVSAHRQDGTSVVFNVKHGTNPSAPANSLWSSDETVTANTTIDQTFAAFNDATVPADNAVKLEITTVNGAVSEFHVTLEYTVD